MALDSQLKRGSVQSWPWSPLLPAPDGTVDNADRPTVAGMYAGLSYYAVATTLVASAEWTVMGPKRTLTVTGDPRWLTILGPIRTLGLEDDD